MSINYTEYASAKYKGKWYYIRGWIEYTIVETTTTKKITFSAGFQTKERKCSTKKIQMGVYDSFGHNRVVVKPWDGANNTRVTYVPTTTWEWEKRDTQQDIKVSILGTFAGTRFGGAELRVTLPITIPALGEPTFSFHASRKNDTTATLTLTTSRNTVAYGVATPQIKKNGTDITSSLEHAWKVNGNTVDFPYSAPTGTTEFTTEVSIDKMHDFVFDYEGWIASKVYTSSSTVNYVYSPEWKKTYSVSGQPVPYIDGNGLAQIEIYAKDYPQSEALGSDVMTLLPNDGGWEIEVIDSTHWKLFLSLTDQYIEDPTAQTSNAKIQIVYKTYTSAVADDKIAIFSTNRNANFSTGLANNVFIGGCSVQDYSSRIWYSAVNNPLYIPDLNYIEVGSNDTRVMGLVKVGDYLGVVKQSKSVDASVFLVYPTSFEDETTFATKACVSGVGALGQYCFNVLGDETLFLSPRGVMAIEPSEDEQSRIKDRSYFVNGRLLEEVGLEDAYSFVWRGMYLLAINNHVYVLDGNQRNSWGNQKTNLVYECYYLENVPAKVLFSYDGELWFADFGGNICRFKDVTDEGAYTDDGENVVARWTTIADDDGSLHYYKTLQKKGNVVSLLPEEGTQANVYLKRDEDDMILITESDAIQAEVILPPSVYVRKKMKKYKRLQFIVEDRTDKPFGLNKIVKSYTVGNYAKK